MLECYHPFGHVVLPIVYQVAMVYGALGHSLLWPYKGLIGCSPGVYGLTGSCWAMLLLYWHRMDRPAAVTLAVALVTQMIGDLIFYFLLYNPNLGYSSHFFGFCIGFSVSLCLGGVLCSSSTPPLPSYCLSRPAPSPSAPPLALSPTPPAHRRSYTSCCRNGCPSLPCCRPRSHCERVRVAGGVAGGALLLLGITYLTWSFYTRWPPTPFETPVANNARSNSNDDGAGGGNSCCAQLLHLAATSNYTLASLREEVYCDGNSLLFYNNSPP
jgi:hypothetical protein